MDDDSKKSKKYWHEQQEKILKEWGEATACYRYMHFKAFQKYKFQSRSLTLPIIIISTITGTANFAQQNFPASIVKYVPFIIGAFNLFAGILTTLLQTYKINEKMENHRVTSIQYGKLSRMIKLELMLPRSHRVHNGNDMVNLCKTEYDRLIEQSPPVPNGIILLFDEGFKDEKFTKPELTNIYEIDMFDNAEEDRKIHERVEKIKNDNETEKKKNIFYRSKTSKKDLDNLIKMKLVTRGLTKEQLEEFDRDSEPGTPPSPFEQVIIEEPRSVSEITKSFEQVSALEISGR
jgi:hypothetical protein